MNDWKATAVKTLLAILVVISLTACGKQENNSTKVDSQSNSPTQESSAAPSTAPVAAGSATPTATVEAAGDFITFKDDADRTITLAVKPQRIVVLTAPFLPMLYDLGGTAVGRMTASASTIPKGAEGIPELGKVTQINVEALVALKPDLVIGSPVFDAKLIDLMASNKIPLALLKMASFDEVKAKAALFGTLTGNEALAKEKIANIDTAMAAIVAKLPQDRKPTFTVLNITTSSISLQRMNTTALEIGGLLNMDNIAKDMSASPNSTTSAPYSMEVLAAANPEYIFMTIHGAQEAGFKKIEEDLEKNPAWNSLTAVKEKRAQVIPADKFLSNPGFAYAESVELMAKIVYPDIFK